MSPARSADPARASRCGTSTRWPNGSIRSHIASVITHRTDTSDQPTCRPRRHSLAASVPYTDPSPATGLPQKEVGRIAVVPERRTATGTSERIGSGPLVEGGASRPPRTLVEPTVDAPTAKVRAGPSCVSGPTEAGRPPEGRRSPTPGHVAWELTPSASTGRPQCAARCACGPRQHRLPAATEGRPRSLVGRSQVPRWPVSSGLRSPLRVPQHPRRTRNHAECPGLP